MEIPGKNHLINSPHSTSHLACDIDEIVAQLRILRLKSLENRHREGKPPKLPSRKVLVEILNNLSSVLYPNRLGTGERSDEGIDYFVGHTLDTALTALFEQIYFECRFKAEQNNSSNPNCREYSALISRQFAARLPAIRSLLDTDLVAAYEGDPAATSLDEILVCYPSMIALINHRIAHELHLLGVPLVARKIDEISHSATGIDIHPGAKIGASFFIDHGTGVVIGETAVIGNHVRIYQTVTLGAKRFPKEADGSLVKGNERHPIIEDDVVIYAGATILGRITIGHGSTIGGNVWLTHSVPPNSMVSQSKVDSEIITNSP
jgi:serine O-acetyltransferase